MSRAQYREQDRYRRLAEEVIALHPNRIHHVCVERDDLHVGPYSESDFVTDLADFFLTAANAGLIKVVHRG